MTRFRKPLQLEKALKKAMKPKRNPKKDKIQRRKTA